VFKHGDDSTTKSETGEILYKARKGDKYDGEFVGEKRSGNFFYTFSNGNMFQGTWVGSRAVGKWIDGSLIDGEWNEEGVLPIEYTKLKESLLVNATRIHQMQNLVDETKKQNTELVVLVDQLRSSEEKLMLQTMQLQRESQEDKQKIAEQIAIIQQQSTELTELKSYVTKIKSSWLGGCIA
jgi:hypothetical protein